MILKLIIICLAILLNIIGAIMIYHYSPIDEHTIDGGNLDEGYIDRIAIANRRNKLLKDGVLLVLLGSITQLISYLL